MEKYSRSELRILWYIKKHRGVLTRNKSSIITQISNNLDLSMPTVRSTLQKLEERCFILRTYKYDRPKTFADKEGANPLIKVELVDPNISLPAEPKPLPVQIVIAMENQDLDTLTAHEPAREDVIDALVNRAVELQQQIDKLQELVSSLNAENERLRRQKEQHSNNRSHLSQKVKDVLTPEQWSELEHKVGKE